MNSTRARRGRALMDLLAQARPASLDACPDISLDISPESGQPGQPGQSERPGWRGRRGVLAGAGLTVTAAATAAVLVATAGTGTSPARPLAAGPRPAHPVPAAPSARAILLSAAVNAARTPSTGRYWRVEMVSGSLMASGPNARPFAVEQRWSPSASWDARSPSGRSWTFPAAGYRTWPATAAARAAWTADGSPALAVQRSRQQAWWQTGGGVGYFGNSSPTFAQFQALPSSPAGLASAVRKAALQQERTAVPPPGGRRFKTWSAGPVPSLSQDMFGVYVQLLKWDPITPQVRAAVFRNIAGLPGVRSIGKVTDPIGRAGYGIAMTSPKAAASDAEVLVINPATGALLADEFVVTSASADSRHPASGAVPGFTKCRAGTERIKARSCISGVRVTHVNGRTKITAISGSGSKLTVVGLGPQLALAPGQVDSFDVVLSAGWTNAAPKLPPLSRQFSVTADGKG